MDRRAVPEAAAGFIVAIALWLWFTVLFANFAEALAEGRSKAQAASLRSAKHNVVAKSSAPRAKAVVEVMASTDLRRATSCSSKPATRSRPTAT